MNQKMLLFLMRVALGWLMFYAGITKVLNPDWTAAGYLRGAKTFSGIYNFFASPEILPAIDFINEWGLALLGVSLILGIGVRITSWCGAALMALYYLPILRFPYVGEHSYLVDEHIIYILVLLYFSKAGAGRAWWGMEDWFASLPFIRKNRKLKELLGGCG
ncbi:MAG: hypothetical protein A3K05_00265 [Candidatus Doudnabacteria bacterium RIFCSPHIGHO2_01_48_18]|uniref:DoxX subfamily n=1 Tax=Candidatus Doudnabacteria bacterium RIFCSPLOWO2_02_FULL_48_13 TaxID=1817845 RepID=A0A1F5QC00_9BACT|nr:MAG: hypothetical protein A3K05_00265 [Candidatus Doudnabacteria bacterium RIFCSPHIGHO2_01_48_18]OGE79450.1 MAG: hypothetical protein A2668_02040 [Candidatus Doudnabacteria bacterium RIFCSPHIGHO2_01_FULL_48_180]OGE91617.1 MAG: hypothetical protein A3F44_02835 [Candidatus Doudnabacteria bacterium RIFCSPHIGHO2_12_FULL_47_25]OGE99714.1 MAG: hypothetical protein A3J05_01765 [Candidatus Doudnabacteria bacterium RIFCSPLOWO2_02_FULL_48_13]OGF01947.1 MAG: hypothetical protein A3G07_02750 [Candidatus